MSDVYVESRTGRSRPGITDPPLLTSDKCGWDGFMLRESGATDARYDEVVLLKHLVCLQLEEPAMIDWAANGNRLTKLVYPNQLVICPANTLYSGAYQHNGRHVSVFLDHDFIRRSLAAGNFAGGFGFSWQLGIESPALRELILLLRDEAADPSHGDRVSYATAIARLIAFHLDRHYAADHLQRERLGGMSPAVLHRVKKAIEEKPPGEISLKQLASVAGLSVFHFARVFRQSTGMSPMQYAMRQRIEVAKGLLLDRDASINDIAIECGFCDQAHFTRHFKRMTGTTPSMFRKNSSGG